MLYTIPTYHLCDASSRRGKRRIGAPHRFTLRNGDIRDAGKTRRLHAHAFVYGEKAAGGRGLLAAGNSALWAARAPHTGADRMTSTRFLRVAA